MYLLRINFEYYKLSLGLRECFDLRKISFLWRSIYSRDAIFFFELDIIMRKLLCRRTSVNRFMGKESFLLDVIWHIAR